MIQTPLYLVSTRGELCSYYCHNRPSWDEAEGQKSNFTHHSEPRLATLCDSVAKFGREDLQMRLRRRRRASGRPFAYFGTRSVRVMQNVHRGNIF